MTDDTPVRARVTELAPNPDVLERRLSLAVVVRDVVTGEPPTSAVVVRVEGHPTPGRPTGRGEYLFVDVDLPDTPFTVSVDAGDAYFPGEASVTESVIEASLPVTTVTLAPTSAYQFPPNVTLVRGFLRRPAPESLSRPETPEERAERGVEGAELSLRRAQADPQAPPIDQLDYVVSTSATGEFALPIPLGGPVGTETETWDETIGPDNGSEPPRTRQEYRRWVAIGGEDPVLTVRHEDLAEAAGERVATLPLHVEAEVTTTVELELSNGTVNLV
jgi:hypothetical protein